MSSENKNYIITTEIENCFIFYTKNILLNY